MKPRFKIVLTCLLVIFMVMSFAACSSEQEECADNGAAEENEDAQISRIYIALGDSVSAGYGIHSPAYRYSGVFFEMLRHGGFVNEYVNMAEDGLTTTALLQRLNNMPEYYLELFQSAEVVTLNIGGNNILRPFLEYLPDARDIAEMLADAMDFIREAEEVLSKLMDFLSQSQDTMVEILDFATDIMGVVNNFHITDVLRLKEFIDRASVIDDAIEIFDEFTALESEASDIFERASALELLSALSLITGSFPPELEAQLERGVQAFSYEFAEIIAWIKDNAPDALIIVNTVYNPIPKDISGISMELSAQAHVKIQQINQIIYAQSGGGNFIVSDIYAILSNELELMNFNLDFVHPNPAGHDLIARQNFDDFMLHRNSSATS